MTPVLNPFLKSYDAVFNCLFGGDPAVNMLAASVRTGNRVSFGTAINTDRDPTKHAVASADLPEVQLLDEGGNLNLHANSSGLSYQQNLSIFMATGDWRYGLIASQLAWYTVVNLSKWRTTIAATTWNGKPFIKNIAMSMPVQIGAVNPQRDNAPAGWSSIWRMTLDLRIDNVDIVNKES